MLTRKYSILLSSLIIGSFLISGCTETTQQTSTVPQQQSTSTTDKAANTNTRNYQAPDLMGEVTSISENIIALKLIEIPQGGQFGQNGQRSQNGQSEQGKGRDQGQEGEQGRNRNQNEGTTLGATRAPRQQIKMNYTGENTTITVPQGISITTNVRNRNINNNNDSDITNNNANNNNANNNNDNNNNDNNNNDNNNNANNNNANNNNANNNNVNNTNPNVSNQNNSNPQKGNLNNGNTIEKQVDIKDIKSGDVVQVWYSDPNSKTISRITVRQNINGESR